MDVGPKETLSSLDLLQAIANTLTPTLTASPLPLTLTPLNYKAIANMYQLRPEFLRMALLVPKPDSNDADRHTH